MPLVGKRRFGRYFLLDAYLECATWNLAQEQRTDRPTDPTGAKDMKKYAKAPAFTYIFPGTARSIDDAPPQWRTLGFRLPDLHSVLNRAPYRLHSSQQYRNGRALMKPRPAAMRSRYNASRTTRAQLSALGELVRGALNNEGDWSDVVDHINTYDLADLLTYSGVEDMLQENGFFQCVDCGQWRPDDEERPVEDGSIGDCCASDYVYCDDVDESRREEDAFCVVVDRHGSFEYWANDDGLEPFPFWHHFDGYFQIDDADRFGLYWSDVSNEWVDEETYYEENREDGVAEYHGHPLRRDPSYFAENSKRSDPAIGLELEVNQDGDVVDAFASNDLEWIIERDGSLDSGGVEIVTPPLTLSQWRETLPDLSSALSGCSARGYNARGDYGIHITIHRRHLSPLQEARMMMFFASADNARFIDVIAQRDGIYCGSRSNRRKAECSASRVYYRDGREKPIRNDKMSALHLKDALAECRVFRSNAKPERIMKNIEFFHALVAWTSPRACSGVSFDWRDFYAWALDNAKAYPVLSEYLASPDGWAIKGVGRVDRGYLGV